MAVKLKLAVTAPLGVLALAGCAASQPTEHCAEVERGHVVCTAGGQALRRRPPPLAASTGRAIRRKFSAAATARFLECGAF